ncbi:hypothetical protein SODALDRAFT_331553 [Sodiomyces alkalinus F11]|uniref:Tetratricopeptide repeat protein 15 n=1 Tax=Sodiomyces alkalinus (strain CBS 110278 / VKM F-3762 / F11) TaxID=1314773 RepID=A0A3N2Q4R9_SODAK|nr:hypothetical protein SODALDRAFT_331553 [Sodiomyces alkalinus F11]ROT41770.1 hypothetical protein SODALDRAFT_331553 [Sodiomyces alkalinus F11]
MSQQQGNVSQGHTRNKSATKASRPRSSTKGPLDVDDLPLNDPLSSPRLDPPQHKGLPGHPSLRSRSPVGSPTPPPKVLRAPIPKDFSFLLRPEIYHPLTPLNVPAAFRNSPKQPNPDAPLSDLLEKGHFRAAAIAAVQELTSSSPSNPPIDPSDHRRIFDLLYTRLACLTLIEATSLAAQEVRALEDLSNTALYVDDATGEHLVPWHLRVLNVRLQAIGFGDPRRSVMSYHDLAREAREQIGRAASRHDNSARELWKARLHDLGVKVAGALIEMDDLSGAAYHLGTLRDDGDGKMALARALLWLHLGDVEAARRCVSGVGEDGRHVEQVVAALCEMADGNYAAAQRIWEVLREEVDDEMVGVNIAVCQLYTGNMNEGREVLEKLVDAGYSSHTLLFNLATIYELCTERQRALKMRLTEKVAGFEETPKGWEKYNVDFKL